MKFWGKNVTNSPPYHLYLINFWSFLINLKLRSFKLSFRDLKTPNLGLYQRGRRSRKKECHEEGSNSRELGGQLRKLTTKPTVLDRQCELIYLRIWWLFKIGLREWNFFGVKEFFFMNFDSKKGCKNEFEDNNEKSCSRFKNKVSLKIDFGADWTHESISTAWELNLIFLSYFLRKMLIVW